MRNRIFALISVLVLTIMPAAAQTTAATAKAKAPAAVKGTWTTPRTPDGQPDLH